MELPPTETTAMKIHNDSIIEARMRSKFEAALKLQAEAEAAERVKENVENVIDENDKDVWEREKSRKRGFRSPLNNVNKKQATENDISQLLRKYKNTAEADNDDESEDDALEELIEHVPEAGTSAQ